MSVCSTAEHIVNCFMGEFVVKHRLAGESQIIITIIHLYGGIPHSYYSCNCQDFSPDLPRHRHYALCVPSDDCSTKYHPPSNLTSTSCPQRRCLSIVYYNKINCNKENVARARLASVLRPVCAVPSVMFHSGHHSPCKLLPCVPRLQALGQALGIPAPAQHCTRQTGPDLLAHLGLANNEPQ